MASGNLLYKPAFWCLFVVAVIAGLFAFGMYLVREDTLLWRANDALNAKARLVETLTDENTRLRSKLDEFARRAAAKDSEIQQLNTQVLATAQQIEDERKVIIETRKALAGRTEELGRKDAQISDLSRKIQDAEKAHVAALNAQTSSLRQQLGDAQKALLRNQADLATARAAARQQDRTRGNLGDAIPDAKEPPHPYGREQGRLTVYAACPCPNLRVWVDGRFVGTATLSLTPNTVRCGSPGTVSVVLLAGKHHVVASAMANKRWEFDVSVTEDICTIHGLTASPDR
jgi:hypothetical protein